jgi:hypothetical protein
LWEFTPDELLNVTTTSDPEAADIVPELNSRASPFTSMTNFATPLDEPVGAGAAVAGIAVGAIVGSGARSLTGMVAGGAGVAVALGLASSLAQAIANSIATLKIADRINSDFLTGQPPNYQM